MSWPPVEFLYAATLVIHQAPSALGERTLCGLIIDELASGHRWSCHRNDATCAECRALLVDRVLTAQDSKV